MKYINKGRHPMGVLVNGQFVSIAVGAVLEATEHPGSPFVADVDLAPKPKTTKKATKKASKKEVTADVHNDTESSKLG